MRCKSSSAELSSLRRERKMDELAEVQKVLESIKEALKAVEKRLEELKRKQKK